MRTLKIKKIHPEAAVPRQMTSGSAGFDLTATSLDIEVLPQAIGEEYSRCGYKYVYGTGLSVEIPEGYVGLLFTRSSVHKTDLLLANCVGVIDCDFRGEIKLVFRMYSGGRDIYELGDRIGQLVLMELPRFQLEEVDELPATLRGSQGFGSTGS